MSDRDKLKVSDKELAEAFKNTNFGARTNDTGWQRQAVGCACLKRLEGFHTGYTMECILIEFGLLAERPNLNITRKGKNFIFRTYFKQEFSQ